ncbi:MAG: TonB-dependent receptor, partial [candidate division KSB1 bacterium]|nr:TonB-dependent receptor [candidate division KSB1 bacterium]
MERLPKRLLPLLSVLLLGSGATLEGQTPAARGVIAGSVREATTQEALPGVNLMVEGTSMGTISDSDGRFVIRGVPPGNYRVRASLIGYVAGMSAVLRVTAGDTTRVSLQLRESAIDVPEVVVTASKKAQSFLETPVSLSVVHARQIEQQNFISLDRLLEFAPGVNLMAGQINIRGSSGYSRGAGTRVLLLIDGVPMLPGDSGDIKWDQIPPNEVDRVEVVKGAASSLYGSNALGGVINIITKDPAGKPVTTFKATTGIYDKPRYPEWRFTERTLFYNYQDISHSRAFGKWRVRASLGRRESTGYSQNGNYRRFNGYTKLKYSFTPTSFLTAYVNVANNHGGEAIAARSLNEITRVPESSAGLSTHTRRLQTGITYQTLPASNMTLRLRDSFYYSRFENDLAETDPNPFVNNTSPHIDSRAYKNDLEAQLDIELNPVHATTLGLSATVNNINSTLFGRHDGRDFAAYLQHEWKATTALTLTASLRGDYHWVDTGLQEYHLNPRFGLVCVVSPALSLRLSSGRGFRAATMAELFTLTKASGFVVIPNPNLSSEIGWSHEVGGQLVLS